MIQLEDFRRIRKLVLPENWIELVSADESAERHGTNCREFFCQECPDARIYVFTRGTHVNTDNVLPFRFLLENHPHELMQPEIDSIADILRGASRKTSFLLSNIRTESIGGQTALVVEGKWLHDHDPVFWILINSTTSYDVVDEVFYSSKEDSFEKYKSVAIDAIKSIKWRPPLDLLNEAGHSK